MKIRAIRLWNVRRFANRGVAIETVGDGVNVLTAENEQGKSTFFDALHALLFQPHTGRPKAVQMLRPYSGGSPRIEADIETEAGTFRVAKQFFARSEATVTDLATKRLVAQADQAETWIEELTRGGASGPTGLLWVRQGITDFESGGKVQQDQESEVRRDALSSVAGEEIEALTGGRRMAWIIGKCDDALEALVTSTGQARKGGPYAEAKEELQALRDLEANQIELVASLRDALDQRRQKRAKLDEIMDAGAIEERRREKRRTAEALEQARSHASQIAEAGRQRDFEAERHELALGNLNRYQEALGTAETAARRLAASEEAQGKSAAALAFAQQAEEDAVRALDRAEAAHTKARDRHRRAEAAGFAAEARKQVDAIRGRLSKAEQCQDSIEILTAQGQALEVPERALADAETLAGDVSGLRTKLDAAAASVTVTYVENASGAVLTEGGRAEDGESFPVASIRRFEVPGIASLTVRAGAGDHAAVAESLRAKQKALAEHLAAFAVDDLAALRDRFRRFRELCDSLKLARAELATVAPDGVEALRIEANRIAGLIEGQALETLDIDQAARDLAQAVEHLSEARGIAEAARLHLADKRESAALDRQAVTHQRENLAAVEHRLGPREQRDAVVSRLVTAEAEAKTALAHAEERLAALKAEAPNLENAEAAARLAASVLENSEAMARDLNLEINTLTGLIQARSDDAVEEKLAETQDRRVAAEARVAALETEIAVLKRLKLALNEARASAREQYLGPVMEELRPLVSLVVDDATITFDENTLVPRSLERGGQDEDVSVLSGGMREQLTVLTRLAFARLLARVGRPVPVILDDALVYSDDDRIEKMFLALHRQARDLQIIVFSCRQRAFQRLGGQSLRMVEWTPDRADP